MQLSCIITRRSPLAGRRKRLKVACRGIRPPEGAVRGEHSGKRGRLLPAAVNRRNTPIERNNRACVEFVHGTFTTGACMNSELGDIQGREMAHRLYYGQIVDSDN